MLVLTRMEQESIAIGPDVIVTVVRIQGDRVKIGIKAPDDVVILRTELLPEAGSTAAMVRPPIKRHRRTY